MPELQEGASADSYVVHLIGKLEEQDDDLRIAEMARQLEMLRKRRRTAAA